MSPEYARELQALDRSHLLHVSTFTSEITDAEITHALYRQPDGTARLHVLSDDEEDGSFVDAMSAEDEARFWRDELDAWEPVGRAS